MRRKPHPQSGGREGTLTIIQDDQQWGQEVTHALDIASLNVLPDVAARDTQDGQWWPQSASPSHSSFPLTLLWSPISHRDQLPQPPARTPILSHSLQAAYAVTRMTFLKLRNLYGSSLRDKAMSKLLHWGARRLLPPPNPPSQSHTSLLRTSPFPLH